MNETTAIGRTYRLTRPDGLGFFRRRSALQFAITCLGGLAMLLSVVITALGIPERTGLGILGALTVALGAGRSPTGEDLVDLFRPSISYAARHARGRNTWAATLSPVPDLSLPPMFAGIELATYVANPADVAANKPGVIIDHADGSVSVVLRIHGDGFLLADASEQDARVAIFGDALATFARSDGAVTRVSWSQFVAPAPVSDHLAYLASVEKAEPDAALREAYLELVEATARTAIQTEVLVTLSVGLDKVQTRGRRSDRVLVATTKALEEAQLLSAELRRAGLVVIGPLSAPAIARVLRERLDPSARSNLERRAAALDRSSGRSHSRSHARSLGDSLGLVAPTNAFPIETDERRDSLRADNSWHRVFRVAEWPRTGVRADWLAGFLCAGTATRSFSVIFSPQSRRDARRQALSVATRVGANVEERERTGRRVGAEERRAQFAAEALDEELELGAGMELLIGLVDVAAPSLAELEAACDQVQQVAADAGMELRMVALRQAETLVCSLPIGRGVLGKAK